MALSIWIASLAIVATFAEPMQDRSGATSRIDSARALGLNIRERPTTGWEGDVSRV